MSYFFATVGFVCCARVKELKCRPINKQSAKRYLNLVVIQSIFGFPDEERSLKLNFLFNSAVMDCHEVQGIENNTYYCVSKCLNLGGANLGYGAT